MNNVLLLLIIWLLWVISTALSFAFGMFFAKRYSLTKIKPFIPTPEQQLEVERTAQEYRNFLSYNGTKQDKTN